MRQKPTLRIPFGILLLCIGVALYALGVLLLSPLIERLHVLLQTVIYLVLGVAWLLPLKRFLVWMETGSFRLPTDRPKGE